MSKEDIEEFGKGHVLSIKEYANMPLNDEEKEKALSKIIAKEASLLNKMQEAEANRQNTDRRFDLDKETRAKQLSNEGKKIRLDRDRFNFDKLKFEEELRRYEESKKDQKFEKVLKVVSVSAPILIAAFGVVIQVITLRSQAKLTKQMLYLSYAQEGRVIPEFKDQMRAYNTLVNKGLK